MIDFSVSLLGLADSFNLLLWIIIFLGRFQGVRNRELTLSVVGDWLGICVAALGVSLVVRFSGWTPPHLGENPFLGILLCLLAVFAFFTRNKGTSLWDLANKLTKRCYSSPGAAIFLGIVLGVVQSVTSVPFIGAVLTLLAEGDGAMLFVSMLLYSLIAISSSFVVLLLLSSKKQVHSVGTISMERVNLLLAAALFIIGTLLIYASLT